MRAVLGVTLAGVLSLAAAPAFADTIRIAEVSATRTTPVIEVPVALENLDEVGGFDLRLSYDATRLTALEPARGPRTESFDEVWSNITEPGLIVVVALAEFFQGDPTPPLAPGDGVVVVLRFAPVADAPAGLTPLHLFEGSLSNATGTVLLPQPELVGGSVQLTGGVPAVGESWGRLKSTYRDRSLSPP